MPGTGLNGDSGRGWRSQGRRDRDGSQEAASPQRGGREQVRGPGGPKDRPQRMGLVAGGRGSAVSGQERRPREGPSEEVAGGRGAPEGGKQVTPSPPPPSFLPSPSFFPRWAGAGASEGGCCAAVMSPSSGAPAPELGGSWPGRGVGRLNPHSTGKQPTPLASFPLRGLRSLFPASAPRKCECWGW